MHQLFEYLILTEYFLKSNIDGAKYIAHCEDIDKIELKKEGTAKKILSRVFFAVSIQHHSAKTGGKVNSLLCPIMFE